MHNSPQAVPGPAGRFFLSVAAGLLAPFTALIVLALLLGGVVPPADLLIRLLPLTVLLALLAAAPWLVLAHESVLTRWFVSLFIPVGMTFCASAFLNLIGSPGHDQWFILGNLIWALVTSTSCAACAQHLTELADNPDNPSQT